MDTITLSLLQKPIFERTATSAASIAVLVCLLLSQSIISAKDTDIIAYTGLSPTLNYIKEEQAEREATFNNGIKNKYYGAKVTDVEKGVKHIKMIRYYNGRPVRINLIELSTMR